MREPGITTMEAEMNIFEQAIARTAAEKIDEKIFESLQNLISEDFDITNYLHQVSAMNIGDTRVYLFMGEPFIRVYPMEVVTTNTDGVYNVTVTQKYEAL